MCTRYGKEIRFTTVSKHCKVGSQQQYRFFDAHKSLHRVRALKPELGFLVVLYSVVSRWSNQTPANKTTQRHQASAFLFLTSRLYQRPLSRESTIHSFPRHTALGNYRPDSFDHLTRRAPLYNGGLHLSSRQFCTAPRLPKPNGQTTVQSPQGELLCQLGAQTKANFLQYEPNNNEAIVEASDKGQVRVKLVGVCCVYSWIYALH